MLKRLPCEERGHTQITWLNSYHSFSFGDYYNPNYMGFSDLRVINDDFVNPASGFKSHPHANMEIITYVLEGALEHKDSMGNGSVIVHGDVQRMTAGKGVIHSEFNPSQTERVHLLQIWIFPEEENLNPGYEQRSFRAEDKTGKLCLIASGDGRDGSVTVHQDIALYASTLDPGKALSYDFNPERVGWLQVATGKIKLNDTELNAGDGVAISTETEIKMEGLAQHSEFLLFDLRKYS